MKNYNAQSVKRLSITVALPVFNEAANIKKILIDILRQKETNFAIREIIVVSDGSTDNTIVNAKKIKDSRMRIIADQNRKGKASRLNEIFRLARENYIVLLDADISMKKTDVLEKLLQPFHQNPNVGLVSGKSEPFSGTTFIEQSIAVSIAAYLEMVDQIKNGDNLFAVEGRIMAIKKNVGLAIPLPQNGIATDAFLYFSTLKQKQLFKYANQAVVNFSVPKNIQEHVRQNIRFVARKYVLKKYFGTLVEKESSIPKTIFISVMAKYFCTDPLHCIAIFCINAYSKYLAKKRSNIIGSLWPIATSTKRLEPVSSK